ncbi:MAG TPA: cytochrome c3 family protein [Longimicrobiales bacterium]|nr:cytochrome c3 family protein [Longimicrobiales bacterium]
MIALRHRAVLSLLAVAAGAMALTSCIDERTVYLPRPIFEEPVAAALDFVGYTDAEDKLTVCGNCHVGMQAEWEGTAHAFAWDGLQSSGHAQAFCEGCHTVNSLGNVMVEETPGQAMGGYAAVPEERYHDVQCESCHGPGLPHIRNPDALDTRPLAPIEVGSDLSFGCGECHAGSHHPFVEEWEASPHGNMQAYPASRGASAGGCFFCHSGEGALQMFGVKADYLEKEALLASDAEFAHITCAVCHDPHSNENEGQLRLPVNTAAIENHLCAQCHDRRTVPGAGAHGLQPHAPEAALLVGDAGWFPPGSEINQGEILGTHGSANNAKLCATCHVVAYSAVDELTQATVFSTGHGFRAIPCIEGGLPTGAEDCALTVDARSFEGCIGSGCHADASIARGILNSALISILDRAQTLERLLNAVDPNGAEPGGEIDGTNPIFTVAEGAYFNLHLAHHGTELTATMTRADSLLAFAPSTTHNPFLIESLLITSAQAVRAAYPNETAGLEPIDPTPRLVKPANH